MKEQIPPRGMVTSEARKRLPPKGMVNSEARKRNIVEATIPLIEGRVIHLSDYKTPTTPLPMLDWEARFKK